MDLPVRLKQAVDDLLHGHSANELGRHAALLSKRYRAEIRDGRHHIADEASALAYLAVRLPATFAATHAALTAACKCLPDFKPASLLDLGAGPGTAAWAAGEIWPTLQRALLVEASPAIRQLGQRLAEGLEVDASYLDGHLEGSLELLPKADLVTLTYVLDEIDPARRPALVERLWWATTGLLVIVEPGTPAGWARLMAARTQLLDQDAWMIAPCPHKSACPLAQPDWCHFAARVARSRLHRQAKEAALPWEDEKFIYLAVARMPGGPADTRVIARPKRDVGHISLKLCHPDGSAEWNSYGRRAKTSYGLARRADWGDAIPLP
ncbi:Ribosomal protein RSM22 (predicted rRNA methylase) [Arboricoccus pini]|uniref:Ribosomal protein RSM22 (Predicted rRNA methylase) n=1 Tax=Arboricoccus pini TaxID=1963835 RepID=A0A212QN01_9PROT|nr:small ribosomal subunit Rsm22 family protein [Arboricoccus pini]SNB60739.1 Ribosomal protein RSM22 (predicted rRNA methylase) [Arboricoccus pini]